MKKETGKQVVKTYNKSISGDLIGDIRSLIETARHNVAITVNAGLTILYWQIGNRIRQDVLKEKRAEYGKEIVVTLSRQLTDDYGNNFNEKNLRRMIQFAEVFPDKEIVVTLSRQFSWSHFVSILPLKDDLQRDFYAEMCRIERWSVRVLRKKIDGMLYERTAISKKPEKLVKEELAVLREEDRLTPDMVFRDPYFLDFLGLKDTYSEKDLESSILREMESFILELGVGFSFVARQKRITVDDEDYYLDLLFFHRKLKRLVAIELKLGKFKAAYKGQMELYLRWLEKHEKEPGEETPLGLILCAGKTSEQIELLQLDKSGIKVAEYMTELPKRELLERKLHKAVELARKRLEA
ncbi:MAG: PDDEXK nuclease domain-containing protein [Candidatus Desulfaltia sp.]|nr:PDDEXK nuclease domain-containing protein [Candidatus Desulfaltia sp.]